MRIDYTEEDTERTRRAELESSAGQQTQPLGPLPPVGMPAPPHYPTGRSAAPMRRNNLAALLLIVLGGLLLIGRALPDSGSATGGMVLLTIASCFLFFAFWRRVYGLLIPGSILAGLSVGVTFASVTSGVSVLWGLALGFVAILLVGRAFFGVRSPWPIFPAVPLFAVGTIVAASQLPGLLAGGMVWLPIMLIVLGLYLGWMRR